MFQLHFAEANLGLNTKKSVQPQHANATLISMSHPSRCFSPHLTQEKLPQRAAPRSPICLSLSHTHTFAHAHTPRHSCTFHYCRLSYLRATGKIHTQKAARFYVLDRFFFFYLNKSRLRSVSCSLNHRCAHSGLRL